MRLRVHHLTHYTYDAVVTASYGIAHLLPRDFPGQLLGDVGLTITPRPDDLRERVDHFGNRVVQFEIQQPHRSLQIEATSVVGTSGRDDVVSALRSAPGALRGWEAAVDATTGATDADGLAARAMRLESPRVERSQALGDFARQAATAGRPLVELVTAVAGRIHQEFTFDPGATSVHTTVDEVLADRAGVCQDFAHVMIGALRSLGLPARYVSGYLETDPPAGQPRLQGADASHAWVQVWIPGEGGGWLGVDPTNDTLAGSRHVAIATGRDYGDVAPLQGVIYTEGGSTLDVAVDVVRASDA